MDTRRLSEKIQTLLGIFDVKAVMTSEEQNICKNGYQLLVAAIEVTHDYKDTESGK